MNEFVSEVRAIPHSRERVFALLSDMSNLARIKDALDNNAKLKIDGLTCDADSCNLTVEPVGRIGLRIVERTAGHTVKFEAINAPVPLNLWIQLKEADHDDTRLRLTLRTELNPFLLSMLAKRLQEGLDMIAGRLADLPYADFPAPDLTNTEKLHEHNA
ncbi:MAG: SRPBCC family protein [Tannerellaceae bacterium]|jgi:hypothetical protein|nr:SRPBCC family protein [Tannerellaceae bacterium]